MFQRAVGQNLCVMVYQEDVIKVRYIMVGWLLHGDILRRAISGKGRSLAELQSVKTNFVSLKKVKGASNWVKKKIENKLWDILLISIQV
jgi:DNA polymerase III alpha subunit